MRVQPFRTDDLKRHLEGSLGISLRELRRLDGASALNFMAVREDGSRFAVKCSEPVMREMYERIVCHLEELKGTKAVRRLYARELPPRYEGYDVLCMEWCDGERRFPDTLSDCEFKAFLEDYLCFSAAMQRTTRVGKPLPFVDWRRDAVAKCRGVFGGWFRRILDRELPECTVTYRESDLRVIHGDFHHGNFLFVDGKVRGYFDLGEFVYGYPPEDIVRYLVCAAEHIRWYGWRRRRRICRLFEMAVGLMPYSAEEWISAVDTRFLTKVFMNVRGSDSVSGAKAVNLIFRYGLYRRLRGIVRKVFDGKR